MAAGFEAYDPDGHGNKCQACLGHIRPGVMVFHIRLNGSLVPADLRHQYIHLDCLKLAAEVAEIHLDPDQPIDEVIIDLRALVDALA